MLAVVNDSCHKIQFLALRVFVKWDLRAEMGGLWPMGQTLPAACFCIACELRIAFMFLNDCQKNHRIVFVTCEDYITFIVHSPYTKVSWNSETCVSWFTVYAFCYAVAALNSSNTKLKIFTLWLFAE